MRTQAFHVHPFHSRRRWWWWHEREHLWKSLARIFLVFAASTCHERLPQVVRAVWNRRSTRHTVNSSQLFLCEKLTDDLADVCDKLTSDVKGIWHLFCNHKWHNKPKYVNCMMPIRHNTWYPLKSHFVFANFTLQYFVHYTLAVYVCRNQ